MVKRIVNLPTVSGWIGTAGGGFAAHTVTVDIPTGPTYHSIWVNINPGAGKTLTGIFNEMRLKVNGKVQRVMTADELNKLNILNGVAYASRGCYTAATEFSLPIWLAEPWRNNPAAVEGTAWGTGDVSTFQLEADIVTYAAAAAGLTAPTFSAIVDDSVVTLDGKSVPRPLGAITKWFNVQIPITALSSWHDFTGLPRRDFYQSIHLIDSNVDEFEVKVDNTIYRQDTTTRNAARLYHREMVPTPSATATPINVAADMPTRGMYDIVFDEDDRLDSALSMTYPSGRDVKDFNLRIRSGSGGSAPRNIKTIYQLAGAAE